jgi:sedoheptulokinase
MHGVMLVDRSTRKPVTRFITWQDRREQTAGKRGLNTGCAVSEGYGGLTISWLNKNGRIKPGITACSIGDYIVLEMSGALATSEQIAASWGFLDIISGVYEQNTVKELGIDKAGLPEVVPDGPVGRIKPEYAEKTGINPDAAIHAPLGDNQASVLGAVGLATDAMVVNIGTGAQISVPVRRPVFIEGIETRPMPRGQYILVGASLCGGLSYDYLMRFFKSAGRHIFKSEISDDEIFSRLNALLAYGSPGADGLKTDPRFKGWRSSGDVKGSISGITDSNFTPSYLVRSFWEGIIGELAGLAEKIPRKKTSIVATGNAVRKNPMIPAMISETFGLPCTMCPFEEGAAVGAAFLAGGRL